MKIADVKIGETYITKVSGALVKVAVVERIEPDGRRNKQARFRVRRVDNGKALDKSRAASALRPLPARDPIAEKLITSMRAARQLEAEGRWAEAVSAWNTLAKDAADVGRPRTATHAQHCAEIALARSNAADTEPEK